MQEVAKKIMAFGFVFRIVCNIADVCAKPVFILISNLSSCPYCA